MKFGGAAVGAAAAAAVTVSKKGVKFTEASAGLARRKLDGVKEYTTACNFCSCGCGIVCRVKDGKLVNLAGDPDHIINQGALCSKGAAMMAAHTSDQRLTTPLYRAPGSNKWEKISWDDAFDRIARKVKSTRDNNWVASEASGDSRTAVNRTDAIAFMGGAQNTNEECYLFSKMARLFGTAYVEHQARL